MAKEIVIKMDLITVHFSVFPMAKTMLLSLFGLENSFIWVYTKTISL